MVQVEVRHQHCGDGGRVVTRGGRGPEVWEALWAPQAHMYAAVQQDGLATQGDHDAAATHLLPSSKGHDADTTTLKGDGVHIIGGKHTVDIQCCQASMAVRAKNRDHDKIAAAL
jgi:hypothetical protein